MRWVDSSKEIIAKYEMEESLVKCDVRYKGA